MAQTRLEKVGTIYSRVSSLLKTKAIPPENKPVWYDIYESFPPKYEPRFDRQPSSDKDNSQRSQRSLLYKEDFIRAKFYRQFGNHLREVYDLKGQFTHGIKSVKYIWDLEINNYY